MHLLENEEEEERVVAVSYQAICNVRSLQSVVFVHLRVDRYVGDRRPTKLDPCTLSTSLAIRFIGNNVSVLKPLSDYCEKF